MWARGRNGNLIWVLQGSVWNERKQPDEHAHRQPDLICRRLLILQANDGKEKHANQRDCYARVDEKVRQRSSWRFTIGTSSYCWRGTWTDLINSFWCRWTQRRRWANATGHGDVKSCCSRRRGQARPEPRIGREARCWRGRNDQTCYWSQSSWRRKARENYAARGRIDLIGSIGEPIAQHQPLP